MALESPIETLKMRFVNGEITLDQYREMLAVLAAPTPSSDAVATPPISPLSHPVAMPIPTAPAQVITPPPPFTTGPVYASNPWLFVLLIVTPISGLVSWWLSLIFWIVGAAAYYLDAIAIGAGRGDRSGWGPESWSQHTWGILVFLTGVIAMIIYLFRRRYIWKESVRQDVLPA